VLLWAALRERRKLGTAMAAKSPTRETTIMISTRVNPLWLFERGNSFLFVAVIRCEQSGDPAVFKQFALVRRPIPGLPDRGPSEHWGYHHGLPIQPGRGKVLELEQMKDESKKSSPQVGISEFLKFMYDGQPEWSLLAVKAPIDEVTDEFADLHGAETVLRDAPRKPTTEKYDDVANQIAVVQVKDNAWTIIFRSLLYVDEDNIESVNEEAKELSARLNTRAITFVGEDTSGSQAYKLFEKGKMLEEAEWEVGGELYTFKSKLRKKPAIEAVGDEFADGLFSEQEIYIPCCYPKYEDGHSWLAVEKISVDAVERVDLIDLGESSDEEDEEEEGE
jgi:hypothetical protein